MPGRMKVADLMSTDLVTLIEDETLAHAQRCMARGRIRHLPVVRDGRLTGLVTHRDLLAASFSIFAEVERNEQRRIFDTVRVVEAMHRDVVTVVARSRSRPGGAHPPREQVRVSAGGGRRGDLLGIVTEADFLRLTVRLLK